MNVLKKQAKIQAKLQTEGMTVTLTSSPSPTYDPTTGTTAPANVAQQPRSYAALQIALSESYVDGKVREYDDQFKSGTEIQTGSLKLLMSPGSINPDGTYDTSYTPQTSDKVVVSTVEYVIVKTTPIIPTGIILAYEVTLA